MAEIILQSNEEARELQQNLKDQIAQGTSVQDPAIQSGLAALQSWKNRRDRVPRSGPCPTDSR